MSGAVERFKAMANNEIQRMATQIIDGLDVQHDVFVERVLKDLRELKAHPERIADLKVSDNDYELVPAKPQIVRKDA